MTDILETDRGPDLPKSSQKPPKRLIVFADGTGNAFGGHASNIWRLYQAIDKRGLNPDKTGVQLARYIPGVGTSSIGIIRMLDGATGFGVPANVLKLYRFLCWNWEPGAEIWMFGFSRGAFTVRTLAGLINSQGLIPSRIDDETVSSAEMARNSKGAWRAYRAKTAPFWDPDPKPGKLKFRMSPLVSLGRVLRDACVNTKRRLLGQMRHDEVLNELATNQFERSPEQAKIEFLGLFDTVEAYGVPLEEVRSLWDFFIWPISFRNRVCSSAVKSVRHALSLDEERLSFSAMRFDQTGSKDKQLPAPEIQEVWFAGVHSDIGGGYPDDEASLDPLVWMIDEAKDKGLAFIENEVVSLSNRRTANAIIHDSRSGLKSAYRYWPRKIDCGEAVGGDPVVDGSVVSKISSGSSGYAPVLLPDNFRTTGAMPKSALRRDPDTVKQINALVLWSRVAHIAFLTCLVFLLLLPWTQNIIWAIAQPDRPPVSAPIAPPDGLSSAIPGIFQPWFRAIWNHPWISVPVILVGIVAYLAHASLRARIKDTAIRSWSLAEQPDEQTDVPSDGLLTRSGAQIQTKPWMMKCYRILAGFIVPALLAVAVLFALTKIVHIAGLSFANATGQLCEAPDQQRDLQPGESVVLETEFSPKSVCWPTGISVVQGRSYWIELEETVPFGDGGKDVPLRGFQTNDLVFVLGKTIRRLGTSWFKPVAQIGETGSSIVLLDDFSGNAPAFQSEFTAQTADDIRPCGESADRAVTGNTLSAGFQAEATGPLFLYVNDAIVWPGATFYDNNTGCAKVTIGAETRRY